MEQDRAAHAFATLVHPDRLAVFRLLMRFAPQGVRPTEIAEAFGLKQNTLSHHLADLTASGLVSVERQGLVMSAGPGVAALTGAPAGRISDRLGSAAVIVAGLAAVLAGTLLLTVLPGRFGVGGYAHGRSGLFVGVARNGQPFLANGPNHVAEVAN